MYCRDPKGDMVIRRKRELRHDLIERRAPVGKSAAYANQHAVEIAFDVDVARVAIR